MTPRAGDRIGRYALERELGRGGQGVVFVARADGLERPVALKLLLSPEPLAAARFVREGRLLARLRHPNLPIVHELAEAPPAHLAMEFVTGESLDDRLRTRGPPDVAWTVRVLSEVARAVHHCHEQGVLHRDLKPANVLLEAGSGRPVVVDFGMARSDSLRASDRSQSAFTRLTRTGEVTGTPAFMAPEQADPSFGEVGPWSDVYGLGATLYALLTGAPPFRGASSFNVLFHVLERPPPDPREVAPNVPERLAALCLRSLDKRSERRPPSAAAFADELARALLAPPEPRGGRGRAFAAAAAALLLGAAALAGWRWSRDAPPPTPPLSPAQRAEAAAAERRARLAQAASAPAARQRLEGVRALASAHPGDPDAKAWLERHRPWRRVPLDGAAPRAGHGRGAVFVPKRGAAFVLGSRAADGALARAGGFLGPDGWTPVAQRTPSPSPLAEHAAAYDLELKRVCLFGGLKPQGIEEASGLWVSPDGVDWTLDTFGDYPAHRVHHAMTYLERARRLALFGGVVERGAEPRDDLWTWGEGTWRLEAPGAISARQGHGMTYDPGQDRLLVFGGRTRKGRVADLWAWDGERWSELEPQGPRPPPREQMGFLWAGDHALLFGGLGDDGALGDTWELRDGRWIERTPLLAPAPRVGPAVWWDSIRKVAVLYGGALGSPLGDVWEYGGEVDLDQLIEPTVSLPDMTFAPGTPLRASFAAPPSFSPWAWAGVFSCDAPHGDETASDAFDISWAYLDGLDHGTLELIAPDEPGRYEVRVFAHNQDGPEVHVTPPFEVVAPPR